jgi:hypothetical protein
VARRAGRESTLLGVPAAAPLIPGIGNHPNDIKEGGGGFDGVGELLQVDKTNLTADDLLAFEILVLKRLVDHRDAPRRSRPREKDSPSKSERAECRRS